MKGKHIMNNNRDIPPIVNAARYAKNMIAVQCPSIDGFKTRAGRLANSLANGRYTHREHAYIMSPKKAERLLILYKEGWDAAVVTGELIQPLRYHVTNT